MTGKNLTPCSEIKKEGTDVILIDFEPDKGNVIVCDCVGILKERHSDIEGKMAKQKMRTNWKKKSTKCRMVFRTEVELSNGKTEILQVVSDPISCTQLPGTPEILKMSLTSCDPCGGEELWMIGKNFMKDSVVIFQVSAWLCRQSPHIRIPAATKFFFYLLFLLLLLSCFPALLQSCQTTPSTSTRRLQPTRLPSSGSTR